MTAPRCSPETIVQRLRDRAVVAREEMAGTALGDALHFEEAADEIDRLRAGVAQTQQEPVAWRYKFNAGPWYLSQTNTNLNEQRKVECPDLQYEPLYATPTQAQSTSELHPDTRDLVQKLSWALEAKLRRAEIKYGYSNGWLTDDWESICREELKKHLEKGDPLDVVAYAAFMWARGWATDKPRATPVSSTHERALEDVHATPSCGRRGGSCACTQAAECVHEGGKS